MSDPMNTNQDDNDLEALLKRQPLRRPSAALDGRLAECFAEVNVYPWVKWVAALAACAAIALLVWIITMREVPVPSNQNEIASKPRGHGALTRPATIAPFDPVRIEDAWSDVQPQGVVIVDGDPLRRYRRQTVERVQLIDEKNNVHIEYTVPREEMIILPARYD